jgi:hypothetical protein
VYIYIYIYIYIYLINIASQVFEMILILKCQCSGLKRNYMGQETSARGFWDGARKGQILNMSELPKETRFLYGTRKEQRF